MKVLFIDDDPMILRMAGFIMKKSGHEAITAQSGEEGIRLLRERRPDYVFIDIEMPQQNGFETLKAIRTDSGISYTRVCMMSGTIDDGVLAQAEQLGATGVIEKPLNADEITKLLV